MSISSYQSTQRRVAGDAVADISAAYPVGSIYVSTLSTNPGTLFGFGTWAAFGAGRVLVGLDAGDPDFDTAEETGGAKTVAAAGTNSVPVFTGTPFSGVISHTHTINITDGGHNHTQNAHNHTQDAHSHITQRYPTATGGSSGFTIDTSMSGTLADNTLPTKAATATNQAATATNNANTTGITAASEAPAGAVASITPAGTVSAPVFTGSATSVVQPYIVVYMWERTA